MLDRQKGISKAGKEWQKQSFVLDTGSDFNNEICIDTFGEKIELIQNLKIGANIEVPFKHIMWSGTYALCHLAAFLLLAMILFQERQVS